MGLQNVSSFLRKAPRQSWSSRTATQHRGLVLRAQAHGSELPKQSNNINSSSSSSISQASERHGVKAEASATALSPRAPYEEPGVSEKMARLKERAVALWQSVDDNDDYDDSRSRSRSEKKNKLSKKDRQAAAEREAQQKVLLESRLVFLEDKISAQTEYIKELNGALSVAKTALGTAMKCLEVPLGIESSIELPSISGGAGAGKRNKEEEDDDDEEDATCGVESFSNIEDAIQKADMLLDNSSHLFQIDIPPE
jgi:hypothetical protein